MIQNDLLEERVCKYILQNRLIEPEDHVIVATSGGPDSTALLHILYNLRKLLKFSQLTIAHLNHLLRGKDSEDDRAFVQDLANMLNLPFEYHCEDVIAYQRSSHVSLEMAARTCRHRFFQALMARIGANKLALGHTANDQAEEVLLRLIRGAGPSGMQAMLPATSDRKIRPLLFVYREEILDYLHKHQFPFREDLSNKEAFCQRNVLRLKLLPIIESHFHRRVIENLCRHARLVRDEEDFLAGYVDSLWSSICVRESDVGIALDLAGLRALHVSLQRRIVRMAIQRLQGNSSGIYSIHVELVCKWVEEDPSSGKVLHFPSGLRINKEATMLNFLKNSPISETTAPFVISSLGQYWLPSFHLDLHLVNGWLKEPFMHVPQSPECAYLDADKVRWPLTVRSWKPGDRFQPLGLMGSKKIQDFFVDAKIPRSKRARIPLLCDAEKICWIIGYRIDDRAKITAQTVRVLTVKVIGSNLPQDNSEFPKRWTIGE